MKNKLKTMSIAACAMVLLSGCSMWGSDEKDTANNGTANSTKETTPNNERSLANEDSIQNMMNYMQQNGIQISDMTPIDQMDFAAHEGQSFSYNGNTAYLYRLKSNDETMKALLEDAKKNGTVKVNMDGKEQVYNASVNGDYLFVYDPAANMGDFINAMGNYVPGATTTTPNIGGNSEDKTDANPSPEQKDGNTNAADKTTNTNEQTNPDTDPQSATETED